MKRVIICIILFCLCICLPLASADEIIFSVDQTEYYFLTGQDAVIPVTINNTYNTDISGMLQYSIVQTINQAGMQYSSSNSNAQSYSIQQGNHTMGLNFGTSNTPVMLTVSLEFSFTKDTDDYVISLDDIIIYFVTNQSQMQNQQNPQQSSSEQIINAPQQNPQQQQQPQTTQEKLQNNQMNQDSQALKDQMQQQMQQQQEQQEAFKQEVNENDAIQELQEEFNNLGYNQTNEQYQVETNNTGMFNFTYQNKKGETATIEGEMKDGEITSLQSQTAEDRQQMLDRLNQSDTFQEFQEQLLSEGFNKTTTSFHQDGNTTTVELNYQNKENETATIRAEFEDEELQKVELVQQEEIPWYIVFIGVFIICIMLLVIFYIKYFKKKQEPLYENTSVVGKPVDYHAEAQRLLREAKEDYSNKRFKDAYGKAGQSIRLFLSYHHGLKKEMTNDELIRFLKQNHHTHDHIKQCLDLCSLVEFAKYSANESDFSTIVDITHRIISS